MKRLLLGSVMLLCSSALLVFSCQKENTGSATVKTEKFQEKISQNEVEIECSGSCTSSSESCSLTGQLGGGGGHNYVSCSCSGCTMKVTSTKNGATTVTNLVNAKFEVYYLDVFQKYMEEAYTGQSYSLVRYHFITDGDKYVETYSFDFGDGVIETVVLAGDANEMIDTVKVIDCTGSCGCKEVYDLNTGKASCSCSDCQMKVTVVKK
ncbi:hypothetical protein [Fluviicola sp.]|uniref:hypothetical protein n=1 Tax=Fluviicola sp. TaxID=1917219 RepID=UPI0031D3818F